MTSTQIAKKPSTSSPTVMQPMLWDAYRRMMSACVNGEVPYDRALTSADRAHLANRVSMIDAWFAPSGKDAAKEHVQMLFAVMPRQAQSDIGVKLAIEIFAADLADLPLFALSKSCERFRRGEAGDSKFAPTIGQIREDVRRLTFDLDRERAEIKTVLAAKVLAPPPPTSEARARVREAADRIIREFAAPEKGGHPFDTMSAKKVAKVDKDLAEEIAAHHLAKADELKGRFSSAPLTVSDELRRSNAVRAGQIQNVPLDE